MGEENPFRPRSAGACPPRSPDLREKRTQTKAFPSRSRHGEGQALALRATARFFTASARPARKTHANQRRFPDRGMARDRPSPYGEDAIILLILKIL